MELSSLLAPSRVKVRKDAHKVSFNRLHYFEYEKDMMIKHQEDYGHITYHWNNVPEDILFECGFIQDYHNHRMKYKNNYLETGTYHNIYEEFGLDGIAKECDGLYHGIQCKLYDGKVGANDLGSFYHVLFMRMKRINTASKGYLYHSSDLHKSIAYDFQKEGSIISCKIPFRKDNEEELETPFQLRYYQKDALKALREDWGSPKGSLICPCGTGKTVIFNHHIQDGNYTNVFILSLYKIHALQNLNVSKEFHKNSNYDFLLVDSDEDGTRDFEMIKEKINKKSIFSITYKSAEDLLINLFEEDLDEEENQKMIPKFDLSNSLVIVDEAHNLINREKLIKIIQSFPKTLLITATPPLQMDEIIGSKLIYEYKFEQAIKDKYICDYQIYLPLIENNVDGEEIPEELKSIDNDMCKKVLFFINGLLKTGSRRSIVYLQSKKECVLFENVFKEVIVNYHYRKYNIQNINCDVSYEERNKILDEFSKISNDDKIKIITSINILNECIDIIKCDSVFITNMSEKSSHIKTIQRIFRANRIDKSNPNKIAHCFIWSENVDEIMEPLGMLKSNDTGFINKIKIINGNYDKNNNTKVNEKIVKANIDLSYYINIKCMTLQELNEFKKAKLFEYCNKLNSVNEFTTIKGVKVNGINITKRYIIHLYSMETKDNDRYKEYAECKILKEHMDIYLERKALFKTRKDLLFNYCNKLKSIDDFTDVSHIEINGINITKNYL
jgi:superfamily II DNA or RNA helicase